MPLSITSFSPPMTYLSMLTSQDTSKTVTPEYLTPIFEEESKKVASLPGINAEHVKIASDYMLQQCRQTWPSDFLTSDLMVHLEGVGSAKGQKASL